MRTITLAVSGMHCASCGLLIDDVLLDVPGVQSSVTNTKTGVCTVVADDAVSDDVLLAGIVEAGYTGVIA